MKFLFALCVLGACAVNCSAIDREAFTFTRYDLDVRIEPGQQRLAVRGRVTLRNDTASPQRNICLQISSTLHWRSIRAGDTEVQYVTQPVGKSARPFERPSSRNSCPSRAQSRAVASMNDDPTKVPAASRSTPSASTWPRDP